MLSRCFAADFADVLLAFSNVSKTRRKSCNVSTVGGSLLFADADKSTVLFVGSAGEKERQLQSQQFDLATKYADMEMRHDQIQKALDHARQEMFEYKSKQEDASSARSSEIDILNQDLERANEVTPSRHLPVQTNVHAFVVPSEQPAPNDSSTSCAVSSIKRRTSRPRRRRRKPPTRVSRTRVSSAAFARSSNWNWPRRSARSPPW